MKNIVYILSLLFIPSLSFAATSYASLQNFNFQVSGPGIIPYRDTLFVASVSGIGPVFEGKAAETISPDYSFNLFHGITYGSNSTLGSATFSPDDQNLTIFSQANVDSLFSFTNTFVSITINYLANTIFTISADAYLNIQPDAGNEAFASAAIDLNSSHSENTRIGMRAFTPYVGSDNLSVTFTSNKNETLYLTLTAYATTNEMSITQPPLVPEPEVWAMMLAGLGLIGFTARCRKVRTLL